MKSQVRVCVNVNCCQRGSQKVADVLRESFTEDEAEITVSNDCFRFCKSGPNVAVNGAILHHMHPSDAERRVRKTFVSKTVKKEAVGMRPLNELDAALDEMMNF